MFENVETYSTFSETRKVFKEYIHTWKINDFETAEKTEKYKKEAVGKVNGKNVWMLKFCIERSDIKCKYLIDIGYVISPLYDIFITVAFHKQLVEIKSQPYLFVVYILDNNEQEHEVFKSEHKKLENIYENQLKLNINYVLNKKNALLSNGDLIIRFKIYFNEDIVVNPKSMTIASSCKSNSKFRGFENTFNEEKSNGVVKIVVGDKVFWACKRNLATQSPVFAAMFECDMKENKKNEIEIADISYEVVQEMLRFISVGKVNNIKNIARDLLVAADKYDLEQLKIMCEKTLINDLNLKTMISLLILAEKCQANVLKKKAVDFFKMHAAEFVKSKKYIAEIKSLLPELPEIIESLI